MSKLLLEDVTKTYGSGENAVTALAGASLGVAAGELVALIGPSGSGKTTFLAIAGALLAPTEGRVLLDGREVTALAPAARTQFHLGRIGFILRSSTSCRT